VTVTITDTTAELLSAWRQAQRVLDELRLDAPSRTEAEQRVHDARIAYLDRVNELTEAQAEA
jgi:hypothetical protein